MMALHTGPARERRIAGILGYSGMLADPPRWRERPSRHPPVMLIHGERDDLIPVAAIFSAAQGLAGARIPSSGISRPG
jgi:phospholipase/carboxylesterase